MKVSVLCTVKNNARGIDRLMSALENQSYDDFELIIVDAISTDDTWRVMHGKVVEYKCIRASYEGGRGSGHAHAAWWAKGDVLAFIGSDDVPCKTWVESIARAFQDDPELDILHGLIYDPKGPKQIPLFIDGVDVAVPGTNTACRRDAYCKIGGINAEYQTAEDIDFLIRAVKQGKVIKSTTDIASTVYREAKSFKHTVKQSYWNGYGRGQLVNRHGDLPLARGAFRAISPLNAVRLAVGALGFWKARRIGA